jgi:tetratricopeptide (TPR) repeat protein
MKNILVLCLVFLLWGCGSSDKKSSVLKANGSGYDWLKNSDFDKVKEVKYRKKGDRFSLEDDVDDDALISESIARAPKGPLSRLEDSDSPLNNAIGLCHSGKFKEAHVKFDESYRKYKKHPTYWNQIGSCYFLSGDMRKALLYYNKARGLDEKYSPAINNLGAIYLREGKEQKALTAFKKASDLNRGSLTPLFNISQLYLQYNFYSAAEKALNVLARKNPNDPDVLKGLAIARLGQGKHQNSLALFKKLSSKILTNPYIGLNYALALKLNNKNDDAKEALEDTKKLATADWRKSFQLVSKLVNK